MNRLRLQFPNDPNGVGSSTQVLPFKNYQLQAGNTLSPNCKFEYDSHTNKYSIPSLNVTHVFDLVPTPSEAGVYNQQILDAGFDTWPRDLCQVFYPATVDDNNFYYSVNGGTLFGSYFGFGTSSLFVCRRKSDAKLLWAMNSLNYRVDNPETPTYFGTNNVLSRVALAIKGDRLYITTLITNIGPQLFCIDKSNGAPIWSCAFEPPAQMVIDIGQPILNAPKDVAFNSFDGSPYIGSNSALGDVNLNVVKLSENTVTILTGISSYQNAINPAAFTSFTKYTDQGKLIRMEDMGTYADKMWIVPTCAPMLKAGDTISSTGPDMMNPFRPGQDHVFIWRDITSSGTFSDAGGVEAAILDYLGANPGYIPLGYPSANNLTTPAVANLLLIGGNPPLTQSSVQNLYRSVAPGIGADPVIYWFDGASTNGPADIDSILAVANTVQSSLSPGQLVKFILWSYIDQDTVDAVNGAAWGPSNSGIRYIASLPDNYVIANEQEAEGLNYYGNSVWGAAPVVDVKRNKVYFGSSQTHNCPVDELLVYQDPAIEYLMRKQLPIDTMYQYARPDSSTDSAPFSTLEDVNAAKDTFIAGQKALNLNFDLKSPRGNASYCDAVFSADLETGKVDFAYRLMEWDAVTFTADDPSLIVIKSGYADADVSSGVQLLEDVEVEGENGGKRTFLCTTHKGTMIATLDISGLIEDVDFDNTNILEKGVVPDLFYAGPDGAFGGSNYALCQDGGSKIIWNDANDAAFFGSFSMTYNTGYNQGFEFHVTRDGRVFLPNNSFVAAFDVAKKATVWETNLGQLTHSQVNSFNGVSFVPRLDGVVFGLDNGTGNVIYKQDVNTPYGMRGITPPVFDDNGRAVFICNYRLPFLESAGDLGSKAVLLDVEPCQLVTPKDTVESLVANKVFDSFDVLPKAPGPVVQGQLRNDQTVNHIWNNAGGLHATHVLTDAEDNVTVLEADFEAELFVYAGQQILFDNYPTQNRLRYVSLTMMTRDKYVLEFQVFDWQGQEVLNCEATLQLSAAAPSARRAVAAKKVAPKEVKAAPVREVSKLSPTALLGYNALEKQHDVLQSILKRRVLKK